MSFQGMTPEALVKRNDSKNPATTCKGLTSNGRPCRRALGSTPSSSPSPSPGASPARRGVKDNGVMAILNSGDAAAFFCWQHKDQADNLVAKLRHAHSQQTNVVPLQRQSSIDTLAEKVGIIDLEAKVPGKRRQKLTRRDTLPAEWQDIQGPLMSVPEDARESLDLPRPPRRSSTARKGTSISWCCFNLYTDYNDDGPPPRRRHKDDRQTGRPSQASSKPSMSPSTPKKHRPTRPASSSPPHSQTQNFLSVIPPHLDPGTTSALLAELSKPFAKDDEAGYIYIFWLTPESDNSPDSDIASTILDGDLDYQDTDVPSTSSSRLHPNSKPSRAQRSAALARYASTKRQPEQAPKILLKIGRAQNVHRRMTQWTKQCGQNISLVRYYPHYASAAADPDSPGGAKMPHVNRVERLIHIELRGLGMGKDKDKCENCGREHREWFEVEATTSGLRSVDEVVKRWTTWAEDLESRS